MREIFTSNDQIFDFSDNQHLITYAEEGFSPLSERLSKLGYEKEEIAEIAENINETDTFHCLLPEFPVTIIPRRLVRATFDERLFEEILKQIILNCDQLHKAKFLLFDLGVPDVLHNISHSIRRQLKKSNRYLNLREFCIFGDQQRKQTQFLRDTNDFALKINKIFYQKNYSKLRINTRLNTKIQNASKVRHWFQLNEKNHAAKFLQPRDIPWIIHLFDFTNDHEIKSVTHNYAIAAFSKFLTMLIVTNLISQITHNSKIKLKNTFGKIVLFPEIVGDCPGVCDFHLEHTKFSQLILETIKTKFGEITSDALRDKINDLLQSHIDSARDHIDELLEKLVDDEVLDLCRETVLLKLSSYDGIRLD
jgi:hypothetical protein